MTDKERKLALYCLKASSDYHSEVCEECINYPNCDHTIQDDVTETIIKALEQEPCEDCISRQAVLDCLTATKLKKFDFILHAREEIKKLPPVNPQEPKTGHWKLAYRECGTEFYLCSRCNKGRAVIDGDYYKSLDEFAMCPNCGAKMTESEEV